MRNTDKIIDNLERIISAIKDNSLSIFAGAGISCASGYVDWKALFDDIYNSLGIPKNVNCVEAAQYYENVHSRNDLSVKIIDEFNKVATSNSLLDILTDLPIKSYWTTNFDSLLEDTLKTKNKRVDIKRDASQFKYHMHGVDATVYKMHGDKDNADNVVLSLEDYEKYDMKRSVFTHALEYELLSRTFMFVGFSFSDPNLDRIIKKIGHQYDPNSPQSHYCFMRAVKTRNTKEKKLQEYRIFDMQKRYGIHTILVDSFEDIVKCLRYVKNRIDMDRVFVSGTIRQDGARNNIYGDFGKEKAEGFVFNLSQSLIKNNFQIITGFGNGVGNIIVAAALDEIYDKEMKTINEKINIHPMTQLMTDKTEKLEFEKKRDKYRHTLIRDCGFVINIFGRAQRVEDLSDDGIYFEYQIAKEYIDENDLKKIIPVGATGFSARLIADECMRDRVLDQENINIINKLYNDTYTVDQLVKMIVDYMTKARNLSKEALKNNLGKET